MTSVAVRCDPSRQHLDGPLRSFADGTEVPICSDPAPLRTHRSERLYELYDHSSSPADLSLSKTYNYMRTIIICAPYLTRLH